MKKLKATLSFIVALSVFALNSCTGATHSDKESAELPSEETCCVDSSATPIVEADSLTTPTDLFDLVQSVFADSTSLRRHLAPVVTLSGKATFKLLAVMPLSPIRSAHDWSARTWTPNEIISAYSRLAWLRNAGKMANQIIAEGDTAVYLVTVTADTGEASYFNPQHGGIFTLNRVGNNFRVTEFFLSLPDSIYPSDREHMSAGFQNLSESLAFLKNYAHSSDFRRDHSADRIGGFYFRDFYRKHPDRIIRLDFDYSAYSWDKDTLESCIRWFQSDMTASPSRFSWYIDSDTSLFFYMQPEGVVRKPYLSVKFNKSGNTWKATKADCYDDSDNYTVIEEEEDPYPGVDVL